MGPRRVPRAPRAADRGPRADRLASSHVKGREMPVEGLDPMPVVNHDRSAVPATPTGEADHAGRRRVNAGAAGRPDVDTRVEVSIPPRAAGSKAGSDRPVQRPSGSEHRERRGLSAAETPAPGAGAR